MKILGLYFTGTGNTKYVADITKEQFELLGHEFDLFSIELEKNSPTKIKNIIRNYDMIGLFHPIYGSGIPKIFKKYLDELTKLVDDLNIDGFTITTVALFSGDGAIVSKKYFDET